MDVWQVVRNVASNITDISNRTDIINVRQVLEQALVSSGTPSVRSAELAEQWGARLQEEISSQLSEWDQLGVPRPLSPAGSPYTFFTFRHPSHVTVDSYKLPLDFAEVYDFVGSLNPQEFLLVPICLLAIAGCNPIVITDAKDDGGVDCIGQVELGPTRSLCIFVQAKTSQRLIEKNVVQLESSKFRELQNSKRFSKQFVDYLSALKKQQSADGRAICYTVVANNEFIKSCRDYALEEGILLKSRRQVAHLLSQHLGITNLQQMKIDLALQMKRDLQRNFAPIIASYLA